jgi:hypothetical protein
MNEGLSLPSLTLDFSDIPPYSPAGATSKGIWGIFRTDDVEAQIIPRWDHPMDQLGLESFALDS